MLTPADDAPVNNFIAGPLAATEDTSLLMTGFSVTDFDVGDPTAVASTVLSVDMGGSLAVVPAGTATIAGNGTNSVTITGTAAEINLVLAGNVTYQGALNFNGAETVNMLTTDTGGVNSDSDNIVVNVAPVDDAPVNNFIAGPLAATEDTSLLMTGFSVTDFDVGDPTAVASTVLSVDMGGSLAVVPAGTATIAGNGTNSVTITGTAAEINLVLAGNVTYQGALNFNGAETVNMLTTDTGGVNSDSDNIVVNVAPVDDAPVNNFIAGPLAATEDTSLLMTGFSVTDFDVGDPTAVASTILSVDMGGSLAVVPAGTATIAGNGTNSVTITGTAAEINLVLAGNVTYQGALNFNGAETVNMLTTDTGGVNSDSDNIVVNVAPVDDAPVNNFIPVATCRIFQKIRPYRPLLVFSVTDFDVDGPNLDGDDQS